DKNPFHNLDSSYSYARRGIDAFTTTSAKERSLLQELHIDSSTFVHQLDTVAFTAYQIATTEGTEAAFDRFITGFVGSAYVAEAIRLRDEVAFREARYQNSAAA